MRSKSCVLLFLLSFLTVCPGSMLLVGEQKTILEPSDPAFIRFDQTDSGNVKSGRQLDPDHSPPL